MTADTISFLAIPAVIFLVLIGFIIYLDYIRPFFEARRYYKKEMRRAMSYEEYEYWRGKLKRLYLRSIPFFGRFFKRRKSLTGMTG